LTFGQSLKINPPYRLM